MRRPIRSLGVACSAAFSLMVAPGNADAALITIPITAFSGGEAVVEFTVPITQALPYTEDGATFASFSGPLASVLSFNNFLFMAGTGTLQVTFSGAPTRAGFSFVAPLASPATLSAQVFADALGSISLGTVVLGSFLAGQSGFVGFQSDLTFARADISFVVNTASASFRIDDFRFEAASTIPEPGTVVLVLAGAGWLGRRQLKSRALRKR